MLCSQLFELALLPSDATGADSFALLKSAGLAILNIFLLSAKNRFVNYAAVIYLASQAVQAGASTYAGLSTGELGMLQFATSLDGARVTLWCAAVLILVTKLMLDYYAPKQQ